MALGFGKGFVLYLFFAVVFGIGTKSWQNSVFLILVFIGIKIIYKILT